MPERTAKKRVAVRKKTKAKTVTAEIKAPPVIAKALAKLPKNAGAELPKRPVNEIVGEANRIARHAFEHRAALAKMPFDQGLVETLPERIAYLMRMEAAWEDAKRSPNTALKAARVAALKRFREARAVVRYVLRNNKAVQRRLKEFKTNSVGLDFSMSSLANILRDNAKSLRGVIDVEESATALDDMAEGLRQLPSSRVTQSELSFAVDDRNKACLLVTLAVSEICLAARFAFRHEPEILAKFRLPGRQRRGKKDKSIVARREATVPV